MSTSDRVLALAGLSLLALLSGCRDRIAEETPTKMRIVSVAPSVTETLFAIGAGDLVVGTTDFCNFPAAARETTRIGGYLDPNLEVLTALRPDLVVAYRSHDKVLAHCEKAGLTTLALDMTTLDDVFAVIERLGQEIDHVTEADDLEESIRAGLAAISARVGDREPVPTLLVLGGSGPELQNPMTIGRSAYLHQLLTLAGGANVFADVKDAFFHPGKETIIERAPELIIELVAGAPVAAEQPRRPPLESWSALASLPAVQTGRVHRIEGDHLLSPGPRVAITTRQLADLIHPELRP